MPESSLKQPGFFRLWVGETISFYGSAITLVALPLTAIAVLDADAKQMGYLTALSSLPFLFISLPAGVWLDTRTRRPILVVGSLVRGVLLLTIPIAFMYDLLTMAQLYVVQFGVASAFVVDACAHRAYLPVLVGRHGLVDANSKLSMSGSVADAVGPGIAGALVRLLSAPFAILIDALSYFVAAVMFATIRDPEPVPEAPTDEGGIVRRVINGMKTLWDHRDLRAVMLCGSMHNMCSRAIEAVFILYMTGSLELGPEIVGIVYGCGGGGAFLGGYIAPSIQRGLGTRGALMASQVLTGIARGLIPVAPLLPGAVVWILCASTFLLGVARPIFNVIQLSLRGRVVPDHLQSRVTASFGFLMWGFTPIGALAGGYLSGAIGLRPTLIAASIGVFLATGWLVTIRDGYTDSESEPQS